MRDLHSNLAIRKSLCQSVTATTTGLGVDTGRAGKPAVLILTDGNLDYTGGKSCTIEIQDSNDNATFAQVAAALLSGSLKASATKAFTTLTMTDVGVDTDFFTIGTRVYELDTHAAPGAITAGRVRVDCSSAVDKASVCTAIINAINGDALAVATAAQGAGFTVVITAKTEDATIGNAIVTTESLTNGTVTAGTMAGGVDAVDFPLEAGGTIILDLVVPIAGIRGVITYLGSKRYLRVVATKAGAMPNTVISAAIAYTSQNLPVAG